MTILEETKFIFSNLQNNFLKEYQIKCESKAAKKTW